MFPSRPVVLTLDEFLRVTALPSRQDADGGGGNVRAQWWRRSHPVAGVTWHVLCDARSFPAVVDDYGTIVRAELRVTPW